MHRKILVSAICMSALSLTCAQQGPATAVGGQRPPQAPLQIPDPNYETVSKSIEVNAPAEKVWARVGKFCDVGEWYPAVDGSACTYLAGDGDVGTVRSVAHEVLVGKTQFSYTYAQAPREDTPYNLYHGTFEVIPASATTSRLHYVLFFDTSMLDADARKKYLTSRDTMLDVRLKNMKVLAEGGKLPARSTAQSGSTSEERSTPAAYRSPNPHYVVVPMKIDVNAPADKVWSTIGHFCDIGKIGEAGYPNCQITSGTDGEYGVVRNIGREVLVGKGEHSYTYAQQMRATGFYLLYHGTIEARAVTPTTTTLYWTLVYDNSNLADDAAKEKDVASRRTRFIQMMENVKTLSEGGSLPPAHAQ